MDLASLLGSVPTPTQAEMADRRRLAWRCTPVLRHTDPELPTDDATAERLQLEHLQHLTKLQRLGKLILNGHLLIDHDVRGVNGYAADVDEARQMAEADPRVRAGHLVVAAMPRIAAPCDEQD